MRKKGGDQNRRQSSLRSRATAIDREKKEYFGSNEEERSNFKKVREKTQYEKYLKDLSPLLVKTGEELLDFISFLHRMQIAGFFLQTKNRRKKVEEARE